MTFAGGAAFGAAFGVALFVALGEALGDRLTSLFRSDGLRCAAEGLMPPAGIRGDGFFSLIVRSTTSPVPMSGKGATGLLSVLGTNGGGLVVCAAADGRPVAEACATMPWGCGAGAGAGTGAGAAAGVGVGAGTRAARNFSRSRIKTAFALTWATGSIQYNQQNIDVSNSRRTISLSKSFTAKW